MHVLSKCLLKYQNEHLNTIMKKKYLLLLVQILVQYYSIFDTIHILIVSKGPAVTAADSSRKGKRKLAQETTSHRTETVRELTPPSKKVYVLRMIYWIHALRYQYSTKRSIIPET